MIRYYVVTEPPEYHPSEPIGLYRVIDEPNRLRGEYLNASAVWVASGEVLADVAGYSAEPGIVKVSKSKARKILEGWDFVRDADEVLSRDRVPA